MSNVKKLRNELANWKAGYKNIERFAPPWPDAGAGHRHVFDGEYVRASDHYWDPTRREWVLVHSSMVGIKVEEHKCFVRRKGSSLDDLPRTPRKISDYPVKGAETWRFVACDFESLHQAVSVAREQLDENPPSLPFYVSPEHLKQHLQHLKEPMNEIKHAALAREEAEAAKERIWADVKVEVAKQINDACREGRTFERLKVSRGFYDIDRLLAFLRQLGYRVSMGSGDGDNRAVICSWTPQS